MRRIGRIQQMTSEYIICPLTYATHFTLARYVLQLGIQLPQLYSELQHITRQSEMCCMR